MDSALSEPLARAKELAGRTLQATEVHGRPDLETRVSDELERFRSSTVSVVVVGEVKRGKSSLINSLVGRRDLLPVGVDVTTSVRLAVGWCEQPTASVQTSAGTHRPPLEELAQWATEAGNPGNARQVSAVAVGLPSALLAHQLVLIDTPGLNSRHPGHKDMALAALGGSDAVVLVVDPDTEITAVELDFLQSAVGHVGTVVLVVTKADLPHAQSALDRTREILAQEIPALARTPSMAVSAQLAELAEEQRSAGETELADVLDADAGIASLRNLLIAVIARRATEVRLANLMWACNRAAGEMHGSSQRQLASLDSQSAVAAEVETVRKELRELSTSEARWRRELQTGLQRIERELRADVGRAFLELRRRYQAMVVASTDDDAARRVLADLEQALDALYANTQACLSDQVALLLEAVADSLDEGGVALEQLRPAPALRDQLREAGQRPVVRKSASEQLLQYIPIVYAPAALGSVAGAAAGIFGAAATSVSAVLAPVAIPVMAGMFLVRSRADRRQSSRRQASEALQEALTAAKDGPDGLLSEASREVARIGHGLQDRVGRQLEARRAALEEQLRRQGELSRADASQRRTQAAELQQHVRALAGLERATAEEYRRLHVAVGQPPPGRTVVSPA